jgi:serine/threonine-protein kinase
MHHAADIRILLEEARASSAAAMDASKRITSESRWRNTSKAAALFLVGATVAAVAMWIWMSVRIAPARLAGGRFSLVLPHRVQGPSFALSPHGSRLVYAGGAGDTSQLYVRTLTGGNDQTIPGTGGGAQPFFSPDGQWVGFFARGRLKKAAMTGGTPVNLAELLGGGRGGSCGDDGTMCGFHSLPQFRDDLGFVRLAFCCTGQFLVGSGKPEPFGRPTMA